MRCPELNDPKLIVDVGSHIGSSVAWFARRYPCSRVISFEASPTVCECLRHNVRFFPNVEIHNVALGCDVELLKLDIEGTEYEVLHACRPHPERVLRLVGKLHSWMVDVEFTTREFLALLDGYEVEDDCSCGEHMFRALPIAASVYVA